YRARRSGVAVQSEHVVLGVEHLGPPPPGLPLRRVLEADALLLQGGARRLEVRDLERRRDALADPIAFERRVALGREGPARVAAGRGQLDPARAGPHLGVRRLREAELLGIEADGAVEVVDVDRDEADVADGHGGPPCAETTRRLPPPPRGGNRPATRPA